MGRKKKVVESEVVATEEVVNNENTNKSTSSIIYRELVSFDELKNEHHLEGHEDEKYYRINVNGIMENIECVKHWVSINNFIILFCKNDKNEYLLAYSMNDSNTKFNLIDKANSLDTLYQSANIVLGKNIFPNEEDDTINVITKLKELVEN